VLGFLCLVQGLIFEFKSRLVRNVAIRAKLTANCAGFPANAPVVAVKIILEILTFSVQVLMVFLS